MERGGLMLNANICLSRSGLLSSLVPVDVALLVLARESPDGVGLAKEWELCGG